MPGSVRAGRGRYRRGRGPRGAASVRKVLNRVRPWTSLCTVAGLNPELSRSRAQRLASVLSHGWAIRSKRRFMRACGRLPGFGSDRAADAGARCHGDIPHPSRCPHARSQLRRGQRPKTAGSVPAFGPASSRHCCGVRSSSDVTPASLANADRPGHDRRRGDDRGLVVAALNRVLQFELELGRQPAEVDAGLAAPLAVREVLRAVRAAQLSPPRRVGLAVQLPGVFGPQRAKRQQALRRIRWSEQARPSGPAARGPAGRRGSRPTGGGCIIRNRYCRNGIRITEQVVRFRRPFRRGPGSARNTAIAGRPRVRHR